MTNVKKCNVYKHLPTAIRSFELRFSEARASLWEMFTTTTVLQLALTAWR